MTAISSTVASGTPQQEALENGAAGLLVMLDEYVPGNVAHYAVEDLRRTLKQYLRLSTPSVTTRDAQADWNAMPISVIVHPVLGEDGRSEMEADEERVLEVVRSVGFIYGNAPRPDGDPEDVARYQAIHRLGVRGVLVVGNRNRWTLA